jgi:hypothetical protein
MFTQFFGNYLLDNKLVTIEQLIEVLELESSTHVKLGVLAMNAGYMTADQVDRVHYMQTQVDKRMGDIAVDLGFLTSEQVEELLSKQGTSYLSLGQALVDKGYITNANFELAINAYKQEYKITTEDFTDSQNEKIDLVVGDFYNLGQLKDSEIYIEYIALLFKNIIRFIGDDFAPLKASIIKNHSCYQFAYQKIDGAVNIFSIIEGHEDVLIPFASRYAQEKYTEMDDYVEASVAEFLNLHNGLFTVNMSNNNDIELELEPQIIDNDKNIKNLGTAILIPVCFPFGVVNFIISDSIPTIE